MTRLVPHPLLSAGLVALWLLLNGPSPGHLILGVLIALFAGWAMGALRPEPLRLRRPDLMLRLAVQVTVDIVRSNIAVARLILTGGRHGQRRSGFITVTLRLRDPAALAVLAIILTATPGTAWLDYDAETGELLLHVFDLIDPADWQHLICNRYEAHLLEIFA